jgi:hypothetical protein
MPRNGTGGSRPYQRQPAPSPVRVMRYTCTTECGSVTSRGSVDSPCGVRCVPREGECPMLAWARVKCWHPIMAGAAGRGDVNGHGPVWWDASAGGRRWRRSQRLIRRMYARRVVQLARSPCRARSRRAAGLGVDRHPGLQEGADVPLDGASADLETLGQPAGAAWPGRDGAQLFDHRVEPIRAVHAATLAAGYDN